MASEHRGLAQHASTLLRKHIRVDQLSMDRYTILETVSLLENVVGMVHMVETF